ncbi:MAG: hypothetical protein ACLFUG_09970 [Nitriliruptoraceae bacterium]
MNDRVRPVVTGLVVGIVPLLLLDLARILTEAVAADGGRTSPWWPVAAYLATGLLAAYGVAAGGRERLVPAIGATVVLLVVLPAVPAAPPGLLASLPLVPTTPASQAVAVAVAGAYLYAAVRGPRR